MRYVLRSVILATAFGATWVPGAGGSMTVAASDAARSLAGTSVVVDHVLIVECTTPVTSTPSTTSTTSTTTTSTTSTTTPNHDHDDHCRPVHRPGNRCDRRPPDSADDTAHDNAHDT